MPTYDFGPLCHDDDATDRQEGDLFLVSDTSSLYYTVLVEKRSLLKVNTTLLPIAT